jgi:hypothetical protein
VCVGRGVNRLQLGLAKSVYIYGVHTVFLAWESPNKRCIYTCMYGSGQP